MKPGDELVDRHQGGLVVEAPAEQGEGVHHRARHVAGRLEVLDRGRAVALAQALLVRAQDQGHVGVAGRRPAQRADHHHLLGRVRDVVLAADDVGDAHLHVVDRRGQVVGGRAVRAGDDEVLDGRVLEGHRAADVVLDLRAPVDVDREAPHRAHPGLLEGGDLLGAAVAAAADDRRPPVGTGRGALGLDLLGGLVGRVDGPALAQPLDRAGVDVAALALAVGPLVPVEPEPAEHPQDLGLALGRRALAVGVLHPQDEGAARVPGHQPVEEGRPRAADVQAPRRAGGEAHAGRAGDIGSVSRHPA